MLHLVVFRRLQDKAGIPDALMALGELARLQGEHDRAEVLFNECLALRREAGSTWDIAVALFNLGQVAKRRGDARRAAACFQESMALYPANLGQQRGMAHCL